MGWTPIGGCCRAWGRGLDVMEAVQILGTLKVSQGKVPLGQLRSRSVTGGGRRECSGCRREMLDGPGGVAQSKEFATKFGLFGGVWPG